MNMKKKFDDLSSLIQINLRNDEDGKTKKLIEELSGIKSRGYFTQGEFMKMCLWKSPRPKKHYENNSEDEIITISKKVFSTKHEKKRIEYLTSLKGVSIPTASAILTITDPNNYGVIDIRVWQLLYLYDSVKDKPEGIGMDFSHWYNYLMKLRYFAKKFNVSCRDVERTLFVHHKEIQENNLYQL